MSDNFVPASIPSIRDNLGMSQSEFARYMGCTSQSVNNWEKGRSSPAGEFVDKMHRICIHHKLKSPIFYKSEADPQRRFDG